MNKRSISSIKMCFTCSYIVCWIFMVPMFAPNLEFRGAYTVVDIDLMGIIF